MAKRGRTSTAPAPAGVSADQLALLRKGFDGEIIGPADDAYDGARLVWNAMIERYPAIIVRPLGTADVATAIRFARDASLEIAVRGGGHSPAGHSTIDGGIVIDLSRLRGIQLAADRRSAWVGGGCILADVDRETTQYGMAVPAGVAWDTGIGGLTLGGGFGWLSRLHGLTIDSLIAVELVTASGDVVSCDAETDPELFWGLRGGGGNFGVVTWFQFQLRPVPAQAGYHDLILATVDAPAVMEAFRFGSARAGRSVTTYLGLQNASPMPGLPATMVERPALLCGAAVVGDHDELDSFIRTMRDAAPVYAEETVTTTFRDLQRASMEPLGKRRRRYWRAHNVRELSDELLGDLIDADLDPERPLFGEMELFQLGGAIADVPPEATAYAQRDAAFDVLAIGYWDDSLEDDARVTAVRAAAERIARHGSGVYLNDLLDEGDARVRSAFRGDHFDRLRRLKSRMDPDNVLHLNANIPPIDPVP